MVCYGLSIRQKGRGVIDNLMSGFTKNKYGKEQHAKSLDPRHFLEPYSYTGPYTEVRYREQIGDNKALNALDQASKEHGYVYLKEQEEYAKDNNRMKHINNIWKADDKFIQQSSTQQDDPIVGKLASGFISTKEKLEKANLLDSNRFSGMGKEENNDPTAKLKELINKTYKTQSKKENKKIVKGGMIPLAIVGIAIASALIGKITGEMYDVIKKRLTGKGIKMDHKNDDDKKCFVQDFMNEI